MQSNGQQSLLFVINPSAGNKNTDWKSLIKDYCSEHGHNARFHDITSGDLKKLRETVTDFDKVVAVGGDGTIKSVAELLVNTRIPLGIIPAGSANGMAKELDIPVDFVQAMEIVMNGQEYQIDLIRINNELCIHLSDIGLNALLVKYFEKSKKRGKWAYLKMSLKMLWNRQLMQLAISCNSQTLQRKAFMVVFANASKYGTGALINPVGELNDGLFELVIIKRLSFAELLKLLVTHKPFDPEKVEIVQTSEARITSKNRFHFQVDGEYRGKTNSIEARIATLQLTILQPQTAKESE